MRYRLIACVLLPLSVAAADLHVISASGEVSALVAGQSIAARVGDTIKTPLVIRTGAGASVQLRTDDGAQLATGESSEIRVDDAGHALALVRGQLGLWTDEKPWAIDAAGSALRVQGYLRLKTCAEGCGERPGVYGKGSGGEVVAEYAGGRSVLRDRLFLLPAGGGRPEVLPRDSGLLSAAPRFDAAVAVKAATAAEIKLGLDAFKAGRHDEARAALTRVRAGAPGEVIVSYYLGLIALEQQRNDDALGELQRYAKEDPEGARERNVYRLLTLLTTVELQREAALAIQQEKTIAASPPEPGSIAVQAFANRAAAVNSALAKGIAAMVISDLGKVPGLKVLERQKVQRITDEIRLSASGLVDAESAVRAGRLMRAERVVVGSMGIE